MRDWLSHRVAATPDETALVAATSGTEWTYAELDEAVSQLAARLAGLGVAPGDHLGAVLEPRVEYVTLVHAAMRLRTRLVPISHRLTGGELAAQLRQGDVTTLVCGERTEETATEGTDIEDVPIVSLDAPDQDTVAYVRDAEPVDIGRPEWSRSDPLLLLFTSGSTGEPKAVDLRLENALASAAATGFRLGVDPDDRWLVALAFHHTGGVMPVYRSVLYGTTIVVREGFDPGGTADDIREHDVTGVSLVPTMLRQMLDRRGTLADSLRAVLLGGAPAPDSLIKRCRDFSVPVYPTYGMTETCSAITIATPDEAIERLGTVGRPVFWTDLTVRDDDGRELEPGESGEILVRGPTVTPGYYDDEATTAEAFDDDWFRTRDVGYRDADGYVHVLNRKDDRILSGGEVVDPGEVATVLRKHEGVESVGVTGLPDDEWGQRVAAAIVPADQAALSVDELESFARERLAGFKIPRQIVFVETLPRTVSGTIDRTELRNLLSEAVAPDDPESTRRTDGESSGRTEEHPDPATGNRPGADPGNDANQANDDSEDEFEGIDRID